MGTSKDHSPQAKEIWNTLRKTALKDGIISDEESNLISNIALDVDAYSKMVSKALEDGIISESEKLDLFEGRMEILEKAYEIARQDRTISDDEKEILKMICKLVINLAKSKKFRNK